MSSLQRRAENGTTKDWIQALLDGTTAKADTNGNKAINAAQLIAVVRRNLSQRPPPTTKPTVVTDFPIMPVA